MTKKDKDRDKYREKYKYKAKVAEFQGIYKCQIQRWKYKKDTSYALIAPNVSEKVKSPIKGSAETKEGDASDGMPTKI